MKEQDIKDFLAAGNNPDYRTIGNNTWAVKVHDYHDTFYGIQLHNTVVFAHLAPGYFYINDDGWATPTTRDRINKALTANLVPAYLNQSKNIQYYTIRNPEYRWELRDEVPFALESREFGGAWIIDQKGHIHDTNPDLKFSVQRHNIYASRW